MLLLIAIHLREKQLPQLEDLISDTLSMKVTVSQLVFSQVLYFTLVSLCYRDLEVVTSLTSDKSS